MLPERDVDGDFRNRQESKSFEVAATGDWRLNGRTTADWREKEKEHGAART